MVAVAIDDDDNNNEKIKDEAQVGQAENKPNTDKAELIAVCKYFDFSEMFEQLSLSFKPTINWTFDFNTKIDNIKLNPTSVEIVTKISKFIGKMNIPKWSVR